MTQLKVEAYKQGTKNGKPIGSCLKRKGVKKMNKKIISGNGILWPQIRIQGNWYSLLEIGRKSISVFIGRQLMILPKFMVEMFRLA